MSSNEKKNIHFSKGKTAKNLGKKSEKQKERDGNNQKEKQKEREEMVNVRYPLSHSFSL